jgi:hypothetical protein
LINNYGVIGVIGVIGEAGEVGGCVLYWIFNNIFWESQKYYDLCTPKND